MDEQEFVPFDPTKKKKKKKCVLQIATEPQMEKSDSMLDNDGLESTFTGMKKMSAESVLFNDKSVEAVEDLDDHGSDGEGIIPQQRRYPWEGDDRDYLYEELLSSVFSILREDNPELAAARRRTIMRPPQVLREGTKKTIFVNFMDLCKTMHRQPEHVMFFLLSELGTSGSIDGQQRLVVKGRFAPKNFERILRQYVTDYVLCTGCKSSDTILSKENRLFFMTCEKCGSVRSVAAINKGYSALVTRRKT